MPGKIVKFPEGFLWGSASSSHQIEGNNTNNDWWEFEHSARRQQHLRNMGSKPEDFYSGIACDSYNRFDEDFALAEHLNQNATRISLEWSRIEPQEGQFSEKEIEHYEKVLQSAKAHGLKTFVTLHHYANPKWFAAQGAFMQTSSVDTFFRFASVVADRLSQYTDFWLTFNEPEVYATHSYLLGKYPPQERSLRKTLRVVNHLIKAHNKTADMLKHKTGKPVSMAYQLMDLERVGILGYFTHMIGEYMLNEYIINRTIDHCDYIGLNYYFHHHIGLFGLRKSSQTKHVETDLGWGIHPEGIERVLLKLHKHNKPIYITENGLADAKDLHREKFIFDHLYFIHQALQKGVDVRGYLHWTLIDNFEWLQGFVPRFGLVEIDRDDMLRRKVRMSAVRFAEICRNNSMEYDGIDQN